MKDDNFSIENGPATPPLPQSLYNDWASSWKNRFLLKFVRAEFGGYKIVSEEEFLEKGKSENMQLKKEWHKKGKMGKGREWERKDGKR